MPRHLIILILLTAFGCSDGAKRPTSETPEPSSVHIRVITVSADGSTKEAIQEVKNTQLVGEYRVGDGLGYNLHLVLKEGAAFECTWTGCLGVYGTASGVWSIKDSELELIPHDANGMLEERPLDRMRIVSFHGHYLLLQNEDHEWFAKHGPDTFCCFHKPEARKPLGEFYMRRISKFAND